MNDDLYNILGVPRGADADTIKKAFRKIARENHPDINPNNPAAEERFKKASAAFEVLGDEQKRHLYDEFGFEGLREGFDPEMARKYRQWQSPGAGPRPGARGRPGYGPTTFHDIFGDLFGGRNPFESGDFTDFGGYRSAPARGQDLTAKVQIDFLMSLRGGQLDLRVEDRLIKARIPAGVENGERLRLKGQGAPGVSPYGKAEAGDLLLDIEVQPHQLVRREGLDLSMELPVTVGEAIEGARVTVPTPWGEYAVTVPEGVHSGARLRLKGQGVRRGGKQGDFYVQIQIRTPSRIDDEIRELARQLDQAYADAVRKDLRL